MIIWYENKADKRISMHFLLSEFVCKCGFCAVTAIDTRLVDKLEILRSFIEKPIIINSGFRCYKHNDDINGSTYSYHMRGMAVDIANNFDDYELIDSYIKKIFPFSRMIKEYIHLDVR